jgi:HPt (histidine-containing phosphotransfer) domain-containing protein
MVVEPWFDEQHFAKLRAMVKSKVFLDLLDLFLRNTSSRLTEVQAADPTTDAETIAIALHSLRGSASMVGALELQSAADELRRAAKSRDHRAMSKGVVELERALGRVARRIRRELEEVG